MKILMLIDSMNIGGAETHVEILAKELSNAGHDITIASSGGILQNKLMQQGIKCITFSKTARSFIYKSKTVNASAPLIYRIFTTRRTILQLIHHEKPEIVHAHTRLCAFLAHGACKRYKIPLIVTAHAKFSMKPHKKLLSKWGDVTISVSDDIKNHLICHGVPKNNIHVIYNGVEFNEH